MAQETKKNTQVSDLTDHIGFWMRLVSNTVSQAFARKLEDTGITVAEWVILRVMYNFEEFSSPSRIADLSNLSRGAISKLVERLLQKDLVTRKEAGTDRRFQDIGLTRRARLLVPKLAKLADQNDEDFFSALTRTEKKELRKILEKIVKLKKLSEMPIS